MRLHFPLPALLFLCVLPAICSGQRAQRVMIAVHGDLIKSDNDGFFEQLQGGVEGSYYFSRKFAVTGAVEYWTPEAYPIIVGARFCPIDEAFVRARALLKEDLSIGAGFAKPLRDNLRIEAMADFYFRGDLAIRAGIAYGFGGLP